jgi:hypothetical protein
MASSLIGSFFKAWYTGWRISQVDRRYKDALREAKEIYHAEAVQEYEFAAQEANLAWQKYTGKPPAITDAFRVLILGLLAGDREDKKLAEQIAAASSPSRVDDEIETDGPVDGALPADITSAAATPRSPARPRTPGAV